LSPRRTSRPEQDEGALPAVDTEADWSPEPERLIADVETLKALSDPIRLRILETMVRRLDPAWTVKELAATLEVPPTRLYHHVELLLERELLRPAGRRLVSGIVETRYRVAALSFRLDRHLFRGDAQGAAEAMRDVLVTIFDGARDEIERGIVAGRITAGEDAPLDQKLFLLKGLTRISPERAGELRERLTALLEEFGGDPTSGDPMDYAYGLVVAVYPTEAPAAADLPYQERPE